MYLDNTYSALRLAGGEEKLKLFSPFAGGALLLRRPVPEPFLPAAVPDPQGANKLPSLLLSLTTGPFFFAMVSSLSSLGCNRTPSTQFQRQIIDVLHCQENYDPCFTITQCLGTHI